LDTAICRACGLVAHARVPTEEELADYYRRQYRLDYHGEYVPSPHRVVREWNRGRELLCLLQPLIGMHDRVVEIGCGIGCTVANFQRAGFPAFGVEPGDGFRRYATEQLGIPVRAGVLADMPRRSIADLVLLVHVLEHLRSPSAALAHIRALLPARGRCYIEVPNAGAPHAAPGKMFHFAHIHNFTRDTLGMLAAKADFTVAHWLSAPRDKNLRVLLQCGAREPWGIVPGSYERAVKTMVGTSSLQYFLRWNYVRQRLRTLVGHQWDRFQAARRVEAILAAKPRESARSALPACLLLQSQPLGRS
jgi:SAM-dependent methyltransferase